MSIAEYNSGGDSQTGWVSKQIIKLKKNMFLWERGMSKWNTEDF